MQIFKDRYEYLKERAQEREEAGGSPSPTFLFHEGWEGQEMRLAEKDDLLQRKELQIHKIILCAEMATDTHVCEKYKSHSK